MPRGALHNKQDCEDFIQGCLFMGTGGGGGIEWGMKVLLDGLEKGGKIEWVDPSDIPDDTWTCTTYSVGSIAPPSPSIKAEVEQLSLEVKFADRGMEVAVRELNRYAGVEVGAIVPVELGAGNTPGPLVAGMKMGIPVVDGDYAGRAVPEEMQSTPYLYKKNSFPLISVDKWGNVVIIKEASNPHMLERISKMLTIAAFDYCTVAATLLSGTEMRETIVPGTLTKCLGIGRTIRKALEQGSDPIKAIADYTGAWLLFEGQVSGKDWEDRGGYMYGTIHIKGSGAYNGRQMDVWFKNENHVTWLDRKSYVCSPDLIAIVDRATGEGFTNDKIAPGHQVAVLGLKGVEDFRSEFGLAASGPRYFGFDIDYTPIEELMALELA
jgi:uncharacterized protein